MTKQELMAEVAAQAIDIRMLNKRIESLQDTGNKRAQWLAQAKRDAGYPDNISFDIVWADALRALKKIKE